MMSQSGCSSQLDNFFNGIRQEFECLTVELDLTRRKLDEYKAIIEIQAKELDTFRQAANIPHVEDDPGIVSCKEKENEENLEAEQEREPQYDAPRPFFGPVRSQFSAILEPLDFTVEYNSSVKKALDVKHAYTLKHKQDVACVRFSADGKYLATGCEDGQAYIYDTNTGTEICLAESSSWRARAPLLGINAVCFSPDGKYLAAAGGEGKIWVWEIGKRRTRNIFNVQDPVSLDFSCDGQAIVSGSTDDTARVWNMRSGTSKVFRGSESTIWSTRFSSDGRYIAAGNNNQVLIWDIRTGGLVESLDVHSTYVNDAIFTRDGKRLVTGGCDKTLKLWDVNSLSIGQPRSGGQRSGPVGDVDGEKKIHHLMDFDDPDIVRSITISQDGRWVVAGSYDNRVRIWNTSRAEQQCVLYGHRDWVYSVDFNPKGSYLASGGGEGRVLVWCYEVI